MAQQTHRRGASCSNWWQEGWWFNEVSLGRLAARDQEIVIYAHDRPARLVVPPTAYAASQGFTRVHMYVGGLDAWEAAGYPTETGE